MRKQEFINLCRYKLKNGIFEYYFSPKEKEYDNKEKIMKIAPDATIEITFDKVDEDTYDVWVKGIIGTFHYFLDEGRLVYCGETIYKT